MSTKLWFNWQYRLISKQLKPISLNPLALSSRKHELDLKGPAGLVLYWPIFNAGNMVCSLTCQCGGDNLNTFPNRYFIYTMIGDREEKVFAHAKKRSHSLDHFIWCSCLVFQHPCILLCDICMQLSAHVKLSFYAQDTSCLHEFHSLMNHYILALISVR